ICRAILPVLDRSRSLSQNFKIPKRLNFIFTAPKNFAEFVNRAGAENNTSRLRAVSSPEIARLSSHRKSNP
ncbi:hypothetical protein, partial [uncultured Campylobacter sp.]|uniref:hypothetical protein n=1 Tax=uncultured Campylobacter sp. TaxID=218934 RepID=UPI00260DEC3F